MIPQTQERKVKNSGKVNLAISFAFHAILVVVLFYFAAREGLLGKKLEKISVEIVKKEKPPEKPKPPEPPKIEPPKIETPKVQTPKAEVAKATPPPTAAPPVAAPAATELPTFDFGGGKDVEVGTPVTIYKNKIERALYDKWDRPLDMDDDNYVDEVDVAVGQDGRLIPGQWQKQSGNARWDKTVQVALAAVPRMDSPPPTNFPPHVVIRFDVQLEAADSVFQ